MENVFCTVLSNRRLYQALALIRSLGHVMKEDFMFYALCIDDETYSLLKTLNWKNVHVIHDKDLSKDILALKKERKLHEYCWTLKPIIIEKVMTEYSFVSRVTYLDSDLYFWKSPHVIFQNQPDCSVLLTKEEKAKATKKTSKKSTGKYNSGFLSFKRDEVGLACLQWWKEKCLESCVIDFKAGKFGDQSYLDEMPELFAKVCDITTPGVNIGPWNFRKYHYHVYQEKLYMNQYPLVFFHFSGLRVLAKNQIKLIHNSEKNLPFFFKIYKYELNKVIHTVEKVNPNFDGFAGNDDIKLFWEV